MSQSEPRPPEFDPPPEKQGMSGGCKILLVLGIVGGVFCLICCGGFGVMMYQFANMFSTDPNVVRSTTDEIAEIEIPADFQPEASMDMSFPFMGKLATMVIYTKKPDNGAVMLMAFGDAVSQGDRENFRRQMNQSMQQQGVQSEEHNIQIEESNTKEFTIRGKPASFVFARGVNQDNGKRVLQVTGTFEGKTGPTMLMIVVDADQYTEEDVEKVIKSIK